MPKSDRELERHLDLATATTFMALLTGVAVHDAWWLAGALAALGARHFVRSFHLKSRGPITHV